MNTFLKVTWDHGHPEEPVWLYSELDEERYEIRKVEVYRDGRQGFAERGRSVGGSVLGEIPVPTVREFANEPEDLQASEISKEEFESRWLAAVSAYEGLPDPGSPDMGQALLPVTELSAAFRMRAELRRTDGWCWRRRGWGRCHGGRRGCLRRGWLAAGGFVVLAGAGRSPLVRATAAASQSMAAIRVMPSLMLMPVVMKRLVKSSRCRKVPLPVSRATSACNALFANHAADFEDETGRPLEFSDIEFQSECLGQTRGHGPVGRWLTWRFPSLVPAWSWRWKLAGVRIGLLTRLPRFAV